MVHVAKELGEEITDIPVEESVLVCPINRQRDPGWFHGLSPGAHFRAHKRAVSRLS